MYKKVTVGFVVQDYILVNGKHICVSQDFVAGDQVDYESEEGETIQVDTTKEQYQCFDMVQPTITNSDKGLLFICPDCLSHRLECCEDGDYSSEVTEINEDGDFSYSKIDASGTVGRFQCLSCGYILSREDGSSIDDNEEVVKWIKNNCKQE